MKIRKFPKIQNFQILLLLQQQQLQQGLGGWATDDADDDLLLFLLLCIIPLLYYQNDKILSFYSKDNPEGSRVSGLLDPLSLRPPSPPNPRTQTLKPLLEFLSISLNFLQFPSMSFNLLQFLLISCNFFQFLEFLPIPLKNLQGLGSRVSGRLDHPPPPPPCSPKPPRVISE